MVQYNSITAARLCLFRRKQIRVICYIIVDILLPLVFPGHPGPRKAKVSP